MFSDQQAREVVTKDLGLPIKAWVRYKNIYLFRVEFPSEEEKDYDPFLSVDVDTGEVRDFSVLTDGNLEEITKLFVEKERR